MDNNNSIFDFDSQFDINSPFGDWGKQREKKWADDQVLSRIRHYLKANEKPEDCIESGLFVKTIEKPDNTDKDNILIPGLPLQGSINGFNPSNPVPSDDHVYFPSNFELKYVKLIHHLRSVTGQIKKLKKKGFWVVVEGECFKYDGTPVGVKQVKVHESFIIMDDQMKFYFELDALSDRLNELERKGKEISQNQQAEAFYKAMVKNKKLDLIFKPADLSGNTNRVFIGFKDEITDPVLTLTQFEVTGGAALGLGLEESNTMINEIRKEIREKNMDKSFSKDEPGILIRRINLHFPLIEIRRKGIPGNAVGTAEEGAQAPYPHFTYLNSQEINIAHELIHAHQNTIDARFQGDRKIGRLVESDAVRGWKRELLAYHFSIFPNKIYSSPNSDPVFKTTRFVRGKSARFGNVPEVSIAFWIWAATRYVFQLENIKGAIGNDDLGRSVKECIKDIVELRTCLERKGYKFFDGGSYNWDEEWFKETNKSLYEEDEIGTSKTHEKLHEEDSDGKKMIKTNVSPVTDDTSQVDFNDPDYINNRKEIEDLLLAKEADFIAFSNSLKNKEPNLA